MNRNIVLASLGAFAVAVPTYCAADVTTVQKTTIVSPQFQAMYESMSAEQRSHLQRSRMSFLTGTPIKSVLYMSGLKMRSDFDGTTTILDGGSKKMYIVNNAAHTYSTRSISDVPDPGTATVTDLGPGGKVAGHPTRHYRVSLLMSSAQLRGGTLTGEIWSATDLPASKLGFSVFGGSSQIPAAMKKIKGQVVKLRASVQGTPVGAINVKSDALSISKAPIAASKFGVPRGYQQTTTTGMMGG